MVVMTQQEFDQQCREHKSRLKTINAGLLAQMQENKAAYKNTIARLLANLEKVIGGARRSMSATQSILICGRLSMAATASRIGM